jgi:hypothetical protein|tara:strand:- start:8413 stop:8697 length:285 start_codon:yes stop_codon:yes gene_type:complete
MVDIGGGAILGWIVTCAVIVVAQAAHAQLLPPGASQKLEVGCEWMLAYDAEVAGLGNFAFPETAAGYWVALVCDTGPPCAPTRPRRRRNVATSY